MKEATTAARFFFEPDNAALLVQTASQFKSSVWVKADGNTANAKSIMGLLALGIESGDAIQLTTEGPDEGEALDAVTRFLGTPDE